MIRIRDSLVGGVA